MVIDFPTGPRCNIKDVDVLAALPDQQVSANDVGRGAGLGNFSSLALMELSVLKLLCRSRWEEAGQLSTVHLS